MSFTLLLAMVQQNVEQATRLTAISIVLAPFLLQRNDGWYLNVTQFDDASFLGTTSVRTTFSTTFDSFRVDNFQIAIHR